MLHNLKYCNPTGFLRSTHNYEQEGNTIAVDLES